MGKVLLEGQERDSHSERGGASQGAQVRSSEKGASSVKQPRQAGLGTKGLVSSRDWCLLRERLRTPRRPEAKRGEGGPRGNQSGKWGSASSLSLFR